MFDFIPAMSLIEIFGLISGILAVWLLINQNIWTWPIGIAYIVVSLYIFYTARLYADLALHIFYLIMSFYGWYYWLKGGNRAESTLAVSRENNQTLLILLVLAMWLQSRKKLESWVLWLIIDILAAGIYFYKEIYFYSLLYIIYIGMAFMGYQAWHKSYCDKN
jgi:nicotinamide mononucleotide transporter